MVTAGKFCGLKLADLITYPLLLQSQLYLECVQEHKGCPLLVRSDYGTENGIIAGMQCFFRSDNAPFSGEVNGKLVDQLL